MNLKVLNQEFLINQELSHPCVNITRFGTSFYRKTAKNSDMISGPIYSKAVTFDLDLESQKKKWQEPFWKSTCEYKHFGI